MHLSIFISVINQLDAQNFCFTVSLFHASTCFEHMCLKHVETWNKLIVKQKFCAASCLITDINILNKKSIKVSLKLIIDITLLHALWSLIIIIYTRTKMLQYVWISIYIYIYRVSQEECARLREGVPYVKVYRYNPKHLRGLFKKYWTLIFPA